MKKILSNDLRDAKGIFILLSLQAEEVEAFIEEAQSKWEELEKKGHKTSEENLLLTALGLSLSLYAYGKQDMPSAERYAHFAIFYEESKIELTPEQQARWQAAIGSFYHLMRQLDKAHACRQAIEEIKEISGTGSGPKKSKSYTLIQQYFTRLVELTLKYGHYFKKNSLKPELAQANYILAIELANQSLALSHPLPNHLYYLQAQAMGALAQGECKQNRFEAAAIEWLLKALATAIKGLQITIYEDNRKHFKTNIQQCSYLLLQIMRLNRGKENIGAIEAKIQLLLKFVDGSQAHDIEGLNQLMEDIKIMVIAKSNITPFWQKSLHTQPKVTSEQMQAKVIGCEKSLNL